MRKSFAVALLCLAASLAGCAPAGQPRTAPEPKLHALREVPATWRLWWTEVARCAKLDSAVTLESVVAKVYVYDGVRVRLDGSHSVVAAFFPADSAAEIWVARPYLERREIIAHELMHAVLFRLTGRPNGHPARYFGAGNGCGLHTTYDGI